MENIKLEGKLKKMFIIVNIVLFKSHNLYLAILPIVTVSQSSWVKLLTKKWTFLVCVDGQSKAKKKEKRTTLHNSTLYIIAYNKYPTE